MSATTVQDQKAEGARFSDIIYEKIIAMIADGRFPLNERLPSEPNLAALLGASRPVVREALERLRQDQLISSLKGSGSYVRQRPDPGMVKQLPVGSLADVQRFFEFRAGLEAAAALLAARNATATDRNRISEALARLEAAMTRGDLGVDEDLALHDAIAEASDNPFHQQVRTLYRAHLTIGHSVTRGLSLRRSALHVRAVQDEHIAIVDAIFAKDEEAAEKSMRAHVLNARNRMFRGVDD